MKRKRPEETGGFVQLIIVIVVVLVVLGFFGLDLRSIVNSPAVSDNLHYAWGLAVFVWNHFLAGPATWVWYNIIVNLLWIPFEHFLRTNPGA